MKFAFHKVENIVGKGENTGCQDFLFFFFFNPTMFSKAFIHRAFNPLPDDKILDWFKLKQIADNILKCI